MEDQRAKKEKRSLWIQEGGKEQTTERLHTIEHMNVGVWEKRKEQKEKERRNIKREYGSWGVLVNISTADGSCRNTKIQLLSVVHVLLLSPPLTFLNIIFPRR